MDRSPAMIGDDTLLEAPAAKCPIDHTARAGTCPVGFDGEPRPAPQRSRADLMMRSLLRIHERPAGLTSGDAYSAFQKSMLISAVRCTLTYVVFPFVLPTVGLATGVGPVIGIVIGVALIAGRTGLLAVAAAARTAPTLARRRTYIGIVQILGPVLLRVVLLFAVLFVVLFVVLRCVVGRLTATERSAADILRRRGGRGV